MIDVQLPKYYQDLLNIWLDMKEFIKKDTIHKGNEIFFNNRFIHKNGKTYFNENLFLKNTYRLYHIIDGKGTLKSDTFFRCMGLEEEEITMLKEIYGNIPEEWKIDLTKRQTSFHDLKIEFKFTKKHSNLNRSVQIIFTGHALKKYQTSLSVLRIYIHHTI